MKNLAKKVFKNKSEDELKNVSIYEGHKYITRRDLLSAGLIPAAGWLVLPGIWDVLAKNGIAQAQSLNCPAPASLASMPGYININLSGGANLASNALMADKTGTVLSSMTNIGMGKGGAGYTATPIFKNNLMYGAPNSTSLSQTISNLPQKI